MIHNIKQLMQEKKSDSFAILLLLFLPVFFLSKSFILNSIIILISFYFLIYCKYFKINLVQIIKENSLEYLFIFFFLIIIGLFFSQNFYLSIPRTFGFFRFLILIPFIIYFFSFKNFKYFELFLNFWLIVFLLLSFDLLFEFFIGKNFFGNKSVYPGRLSGVLGTELKIGFFYFIFGSLLISFVYYKYRKIKYFISLFLFTLIISFLIGERANFIKVFISICLFLFFIEKKIKKILFATLIFTFLTTITFSILFQGKNIIIERYYTEFFKPLVQNPKIYFKEQLHGAHYATSLKIFKHYPIAGIGIKNFREVCNFKKFEVNDYKFNNKRCSTHPHQIHLEILSELGIFIYLFFIYIFLNFGKNQIKFYRKNKNNFLLIATTITTLTYIFSFPLPTGSFFTSYTASLFWFIYALSISLRKWKNKN